ncbi:uncharacterized protein TNCV_2099381 [Trichonephila clavipes]|nr:uncharacterized protein TNCV_2099381 [Trichonephila clavipes]
MAGIQKSSPKFNSLVGGFFPVPIGLTWEHDSLRIKPSPCLHNGNEEGNFSKTYETIIPNKIFNRIGHLSSSLVETENSDEDLRLSESDCEEFEESADIINNIPVNFDIYIARDSTEQIPHDSNAHDRFASRNVLRQSSSPTSFTKHSVNVSFL